MCFTHRNRITITNRAWGVTLLHPRHTLSRRLFIERLLSTHFTDRATTEIKKARGIIYSTLMSVVGRISVRHRQFQIHPNKKFKKFCRNMPHFEISIVYILCKVFLYLFCLFKKAKQIRRNSKDRERLSILGRQNTELSYPL